MSAGHAEPIDGERLYAAVLGDFVGSRRAGDRQALQRRLLDAFARVAASTAPVQPFAFTIGDEFQAIFDSIPRALRGILELRFELAEVGQVRFGLGWGAIPVSDRAAAPFGQDGPGWWAARNALDAVAASEKRRRRPTETRLGFEAALPLAESRWIQGLTVALDTIVSTMDERDQAIALGLLRGATQSEIAEGFDVTQSAIAQRSVRNGPYAVVEILKLLDEEPA